MKMIAFLGNGKYLPCQYKFNDELSGVVTYVQTATRKFFPEISKCILFCTDEAAASHWEGLVAEFQKFGFPMPEKVGIPSGGSEDELWKIFDIVCNHVADEEKVIFDVTHSYRSLPIVMTVLVNYLESLRQVQLCGCYYGAFEKLGPARKVEEEIARPEDRVADIFDLTGFFSLNDWTRAIGDFQKYGTARELSEVVKRELVRLSLDDEKSQRLKDALACVQEFCEATRLGNVSRLSRLDIPGRLMPNLGDGLCDLPAFKDVFNQLKPLFAGYGRDEISDGLQAARWAADHELIPQAFTMLQETLVSYGVRLYEKLSHKPDVVKDDVLKRTYVSTVLGHWNPEKPEKWDEKESGPRDCAREMGELLGDKLLKLGKEIGRRRNELNHGGVGRKDQLKSAAEALQIFNKVYFDCEASVRC